MKQNVTIEQVKLQTEKQHLILRLRLAMSTNRYDMIEGLGRELRTINLKQMGYEQKTTA